MPLYHHKLNFKALDEYKSSELTMPSDGLVFYASLKNSINAESGHEGNGIIKSYEFVTENGIQCIKSNSNNAAIQYPTWSEITGNNSLSISFWMKGKCEHQDDNIITYGTWATDKLRAARFMGSGSSALLGCEAGDDFTSGGIKTTNNDGNSKWIHIVVIFEDLNDEFEYRVYGNTVLGYIKHRNVVNTTIDSSHRGLFLFSKPDTGEQHYNGCLCALRLYNRVLSQEEITTLSQEFVPISEYSTKGFDDFGFSIPYDSAINAECDVSINNLTTPHNLESNDSDPRYLLSMSDYIDSSRNAYAAMDDSLDSQNGCAHSSNSSAGSWWKIKFNEGKVKLKKIKFTHRQFSDGSYSAQNYILSGSNDDENYENIMQINVPFDSGKQYEFDVNCSTKYQYYKLTSLDDTYLIIGEIEFLYKF